MKARRVIAVILWVLSALILIFSVDQQHRISAMPTIIVFVLIGLLLFFVKGKPGEEKTKVNSERLSTSLVKHFTGLPLAEGTNCKIQHNPNDFSFAASGNIFSLSNDKITDMCIKTDAEIQRQYVSSVGGAVGGAVLFGPIGAMIGGRTKEKKMTSITHYLIITYLKDGQVSYICFEINEIDKIQKWINEFQQCPHAQGVSVEL